MMCEVVALAPAVRWGVTVFRRHRHWRQAWSWWLWWIAAVARGASAVASFRGIFYLVSAARADSLAGTHSAGACCVCSRRSVRETAVTEMTLSAVQAAEPGP